MADSLVAAFHFRGVRGRRFRRCIQRSAGGGLAERCGGTTWRISLAGGNNKVVDRNKKRRRGAAEENFCGNAEDHKLSQIFGYSCFPRFFFEVATYLGQLKG